MKNAYGLPYHISDDLTHWTERNPIDHMHAIRKEWAILTDNDNPEKVAILQKFMELAVSNARSDDSYDG